MISVSVVLARPGGLYGEYFNNAFLDGPTVLSRIDNYLDFDWGQDLITNEAGDFVSAHWYGKIRAPVTEEFTFIFNGDDGFRFYFETELLVDRWDTCCDEMQVRLNLVKDQFYDVIFEYKEIQETASFRVEWLSMSIMRQVIPPTSLYYSQRLGTGVYPVQILSGPSISGKSTIEYKETSLVAGKLSYVDI
jgi:hypothetical protein